VSGHARTRGAVTPWSVVWKWTDSPTTTPTAPIERARREALAYRSGLLRRASGLTVPDAYAVDLAEDGHVELWLEDVHADDAGPWPLERFVVAARALGRFNGAFLDGPLPDDPWLVRDWAERQSEPLDVRAAHAELATAVGRPARVAGARRRHRGAGGPDAGRPAATRLGSRPVAADAVPPRRGALEPHRTPAGRRCHGDRRDRLGVDGTRSDRRRDRDARLRQPARGRLPGGSRLRARRRGVRRVPVRPPRYRLGRRSARRQARLHDEPGAPVLVRPRQPAQPSRSRRAARASAERWTCAAPSALRAFTAIASFLLDRADEARELAPAVLPAAR
jgi:hypothetical protein